MKQILTLLTLCTLFLPLPAARAAMTIGHLRCEYRENPVGIDPARPRLSWILSSNHRNERQTAYRVLVSSSPERLRQGKGDLWDSGKVASSATIQIEYSGSPLTSRQRCYWKVRTWDKTGSASVWSETASWSMGLLQPGDWHAHWIGVQQTPEPPPPAAPALPAPIIRKAMYETVDGTASLDVTALLAGKVQHGGISLPVSNETMGSDPALGHPKRLHVEYEYAGKSFKVDVPETGQLTIPDDFTPEVPASIQPAIPRTLRKTFTVPGQVGRATLYITALGLYEVYLNGSRVGDHLLAPEWTDYNKRVQYQTYDVTSLVKPGRNAIGAVLGNGWYCGNWQFWQSKLKPIYGTQPYLLAQLEIDRADGEQQTITSDGSWRGTTRGPIRFSGIYEGETYDARRAMPGWDTARFDDSRWQAVTVAAPRVGQLVWQRSEPIHITQELKPVSISEPKPGLYVFDLGQNMAGWCRLHVHEPAGTKITLRYNEVLNPDGTVYMDNLHAGHLSTGDRQIVRYISGGGDETYEPHFTYGGFRYIEVSGLTRRPGRDFLTGEVFHSGMTQTGTFTCSNPLVNRLAENIHWSQRANMMGVPTDCCQRDERCGYTGDMNFFMPTAVYNYDIAAFASKWLVDVCEDSQLPDGHFADHAPTYGPGNGWNVGWSDAGVICPWVIWKTYGDTRVIRDHYAAIQRNLALLKRTSQHDLRLGQGGNGDWLNLGGGATMDVIGTAYDAYDFRLASEMAAAIGKHADAAAYRARAAQIADAFVRAFVDGEGQIKGSSQTGYALAFTMGLVPAPLKGKMAARFADEIRRFNGHLATGFIGTPRLLPGLHQAGRDDLAYQLLLNETFPSWLYQVKNGATTMWERWDGWRPDKGFADSGMNSFNHYAFGSVGQYLYSVVGGIQADSPGYGSFFIRPVPEQGLRWASTTFDSPHGRIVSNWKRDGERLSLDIEIPANTTATVAVPARSAASVLESGKPAVKAEGVQFVRFQNEAAVYKVGSGHYHFTAEAPPDLNPAKSPTETKSH